jgi:hypothetical protein
VARSTQSAPRVLEQGMPSTPDGKLGLFS